LVPCTYHYGTRVRTMVHVYYPMVPWYSSTMVCLDLASYHEYHWYATGMALPWYHWYRTNGTNGTHVCTRVRTMVHVYVRTYVLIMLCHNFLIGKGHTCALRTTCVLGGYTAAGSECRATHTYTLATALTPLPRWRGLPYVRTYVLIMLCTYTCTNITLSQKRLEIQALSTYVPWYVRTVHVYVLLMLCHNFLIGKGHTCVCSCMPIPTISPYGNTGIAISISESQSKIAPVRKH
jgi:hypothetical protein